MPHIMLDRSPFFQYNILAIEVWRSLVSRLVRVQETSGSNPDTSTSKHRGIQWISRCFSNFMVYIMLNSRHLSSGYRPSGAPNPHTRNILRLFPEVSNGYVANRVWTTHSTGRYIQQVLCINKWRPLYRNGGCMRSHRYTFTIIPKSERYWPPRSAPW